MVCVPVVRVESVGFDRLDRNSKVHNCESGNTIGAMQKHDLRVAVYY
jgi:hypothetical protein